MKKNLNFPKLLFFASTMFFCLYGCGSSDDDDETPSDKEVPTVIISSPTAATSLSAGGNVFPFVASFTDDVELKECIVSLVYSGDVKSSSGVNDPNWEPENEIITIGGKTDEIETSIFSEDYVDQVIPREIKTGEYSLTVTVVDKAGKSSIETVMVKID